MLPLTYNLLDQSAAEVIELARSHKVGVFAATTLLYGLLAGADPRQSGDRLPAHISREKFELAVRLWEFARRCNVSLLALNLHWILRNPGVSSVLLGAATPGQIETDVQVFSSGEITEAIFAELEKEFEL